MTQQWWSCRCGSWSYCGNRACRACGASAPRWAQTAAGSHSTLAPWVTKAIQEAAQHSLGSGGRGTASAPALDSQRLGKKKRKKQGSKLESTSSAVPQAPKAPAPPPTGPPKAPEAPQGTSSTTSATAPPVPPLPEAPPPPAEGDPPAPEGKALADISEDDLRHTLRLNKSCPLPAAQLAAAALQAELDRRAAARLEAKPGWAQLRGAEVTTSKRKAALEKRTAAHEAAKKALAEAQATLAEAASKAAEAQTAYDEAYAAEQIRRQELAAAPPPPPPAAPTLSALLSAFRDVLSSVPPAAQDAFEAFRAALAEHPAADEPMGVEPSPPKESPPPEVPAPPGPQAQDPPLPVPSHDPKVLSPPGDPSPSQDALGQGTALAQATSQDGQGTALAPVSSAEQGTALASAASPGQGSTLAAGVQALQQVVALSNLREQGNPRKRSPTSRSPRRKQGAVDVTDSEGDEGDRPSRRRCPE